MIRVTYLPEENRYKVHQFEFKYSVFNTDVRYPVESEFGLEIRLNPKPEFRGKWKSKTTISGGSVIFQSKKGTYKVLDTKPRAVGRRKFLLNKTYKNGTHEAENVFLIVNGLEPRPGGFTHLVNPVLKDTPYTQRSCPLKFPDLKALFHYYKVNGKVLRKWTLNGQDEEFVKKLLILRGFSNVTAGVLQSFTDKFPRLYVATPNELKKLRKFNSEFLMRDIVREFKAEEGYEHFKDLDRLEKEYKKHVSKKLPEVKGLWQYHTDLATGIILKKYPEAETPFNLTEKEKLIDGARIEGYTLKVPHSQLDLIKWGKIQAHCVGTHTPNPNYMLLSIWKENRLISCMALRSSPKEYMEMDVGRPNSLPYIVPDWTKGKVWKVSEHRGFRNRPPKIANNTLNTIEQVILNTLNEEKETNEKVLC